VPIGAEREGPKYGLTIVAKDRSGKPLTGMVTVTAERLMTTVELDASGTGTLRLPARTYGGWLIATVQGAKGPHSLGMALLSFAGLQLDRDRTVTLDARKVRQVKVNVPKEATAVISRLDVRQEFSDSSTSTCTMLPGDRDYGFEAYDSVWALPTAGKAAGFAFGARFRLEQPALTLGTKTKTYKDLLVERAATPLPAGTRKLTAVFAGEEIAVVRRSDSVGIKEQAAAAAAAGARVLLVVNDGDGRLSPWDNITGSTLHPPALTVATLDADQGGPLIDTLQRSRVELTVTSHPTTDYVYDLVVLPREVGDAAGGWLALERGVSAVVIVGVEPLRVCVASFGLGSVGLRVGPFIEQGPVEALDLAVGLGPVGAGALV
jgi:hypothetical protein